MAKATSRQRRKEVLVSFESGHYKTVRGTWTGDSVWTHFHKGDGLMVHINKDKVEYMEDLAYIDPDPRQEPEPEEVDFRELDRDLGALKRG
jgi:hypothetical protein